MKPKNFIKKGIQHMILSDKKTLPKRDLLDSSERNITAHLRSSLIRVDIKIRGVKYQIDHEYNRKGISNKPKDLSEDCLKCLGRRKNYVVPDIIIHLRGVTWEENGNANWLVIEVKKILNFNGSIEDLKNKRNRNDLKNDLIKLICFKKDQRFQYKHAASVVFSKDKIWISLDEDIFNKKFIKL